MESVLNSEPFASFSYNVSVAVRMSHTSIQLRWDRFERSARHVFSNWTLLRLAIDQGWGGKHSGEKAESLVNTVLEQFHVAAYQDATKLSEVHELADFLCDQVETLFSAEAGDESDMEVAQLLLQLFTTINQGDFTLADEVDQSYAAEPSKCTHTTSNSESDSDETGESDSDAHAESQLPTSHHSSAPLQVQSTKQRPDEDGWITVSTAQKPR